MRRILILGLALLLTLCVYGVMIAGSNTLVANADPISPNGGNSGLPLSPNSTDPPETDFGDPGGPPGPG